VLTVGVAIMLARRAVADDPVPSRAPGDRRTCQMQIGWRAGAAPSRRSSGAGQAHRVRRIALERL